MTYKVFPYFYYFPVSALDFDPGQVLSALERIKNVGVMKHLYLLLFGFASEPGRK